MTPEDKELLLKDLCARLPYGVLILDTAAEKYGGLYQINFDFVWYDCQETGDVECQTIFNTRPYLRPMSSMTEEECKELGDLPAIIENVSETLPNIPYYIEVARPEQLDWLNAHHFDYRGLIEKGLALEAPEGMYNG